MNEHKTELTAKEIIAKAFATFNSFYEGKRLKNILLEGLERNDDTWDVVIGYDIGREKVQGRQFSFMDQTVEPIREARTITVRAEDGEFVRMY
jgi:hypothetical protein